MKIETGIGIEEFFPVVMSGKQGYWNPDDGVLSFHTTAAFEKKVALRIYKEFDGK